MMNNSNITTRRDFINKSLLSIAALTIPWDSKLFSNNLLVSEKEPNQFFNRSDLTRIRENTKLPFIKPYWDSLLNADLKADTKFLEEEIDFHNHVYHLNRADEILKRSAFVSLITDNKDHEKVAKLAIQKIHTFNEWDYFTENSTETIGLQRAPETTMAMSFAYDWLYEKLSEEERKTILDAILKKGIPPCYLTLYGMKNPEKVKGWGYNPTTTYKYRVDLSRWPYFLNRTNLKVIPIAGLTIGSILLYDKHPDSHKWLKLAEESLIAFSKIYGKDGSYDEGVGYWSYSTQHIILSVDILRRKMNIDHRKLFNFPGTSRFVLQSQMPTKENTEQVVNFSDCGFLIDATPSFWVAKEFNDGLAKYNGECFSQRRNIFAFVWYDNTIKTKKPTDDLNDVKFDIGRIVSRSGFEVDDTVIALRSGGPSNHEHADRNSIILKAYGERLFHDPLGAAYFNTDKHWLLRQSEAHNMVLIDGKGHQYLDGHEGTNSSKAEAKIVQYRPGKKISVFTSDATQAYNLINPDVTKVQRTVVFIKPDFIILIDELEKEKISSAFQLRFQAFNTDGKAKLKTDDNSFEITRPYAKVIGEFYTDTKYKIVQGKLDIPEDKGVFPFIEISTEAALKCRILTVCSVAPLIRNAKQVIKVSQVKDSYKINYETEKIKGILGIIFGEKYPVIK
jgi:hypothetical protein